MEECLFASEGKRDGRGDRAGQILSPGRRPRGPKTAARDAIATGHGPSGSRQEGFAPLPRERATARSLCIAKFFE